jgi:hypothetical protein
VTVIPRLKSAIWVHAFIRRLATEGKNAVVLQKGHEEAGVIFVVINHLDGMHDILAPPPGPAVDEEGDRHFEKANASPMNWFEAKEWLDRRKKSDSDIWIVEAEDRDGLAGLKTVK